MSWEDIDPPRVSGSTLQSVPVTVAMTQLGRARRLWMVVTIRPWLIPDCGFLRHGALVGVARGLGNHAGMLRVSPSGPFRLGLATRSEAARKTLSLRMPALPRAATEGRAGVPVKFRGGADGLEIELPEWAWAAVSAAAPDAPRGRP